MTVSIFLPHVSSPNRLPGFRCFHVILSGSVLYHLMYDLFICVNLYKIETVTNLTAQEKFLQA